MGNFDSPKADGDPPGETLTEARKRLWREGRYGAFEARFKELAKGASTRTEQGRKAFYEALQEFQPSATGDGGVSTGSGRYPFHSPMPRFNDTDDLEEELPEADGPIEDDVRWAYNTLPIYWDLASRNDLVRMRCIEVFEAPNLGAVQMLRAAYCDPVRFTLEVVPLMLGGQTSERDDRSRPGIQQ